MFSHPHKYDPITKKCLHHSYELASSVLLKLLEILARNSRDEGEELISSVLPLKRNNLPRKLKRHPGQQNGTNTQIIQ